MYVQKTWFGVKCNDEQRNEGESCLPNMKMEGVE